MQAVSVFAEAALRLPFFCFGQGAQTPLTGVGLVQAVSVFAEAALRLPFFCFGQGAQAPITGVGSVQAVSVFAGAALRKNTNKDGSCAVLVCALCAPFFLHGLEEFFYFA